MYHLLCYKWVIIFDVLFSSFAVLTFCLLLLHDYKKHFKHFFTVTVPKWKTFFYTLHTDKALTYEEKSPKSKYRECYYPNKRVPVSYPHQTNCIDKYQLYQHHFNEF